MEAIIIQYPDGISLRIIDNHAWIGSIIGDYFDIDRINENGMVEIDVFDSNHCLTGWVLVNSYIVKKIDRP